MTYRKKLIEVALPLNAINEASIREKSIRHGHPSTLHLWWSRKPLATCRAVLFASLVDDPSEHPEEFPTEREQDLERLRLHALIEELVKWENSNNESVLQKAHAEILKSTGGNPPPVLDPFCGGGSIPLEAQRLGLEAHGSDLNPVAVLISKALFEIPPKFAGRSPINPEAKKSLMGGDWRGAKGLADDIRYYGKWMSDEAERSIGHLYPKVTLSKEYGGGEATVIAWLWVRTVTCPNPACGAQMPLTSKWWLSKKKEKPAWVEPIMDYESMTVSFVVHTDEPEVNLMKNIGLGTSSTGSQGKKTKATFGCIFCNIGVARGDYIDAEANRGKMGALPIAVVVESKHGRTYLPVDNSQTQIIREKTLQLLSRPDIFEKVPTEPARGTFASNAQGRIYGFKTFADYFTSRQLVTLIVFSNLIREARDKVLADAKKANLSVDTIYADAVATYLAIGIDRLSDRNSSMCSWDTGYVKVRNTFARQAISMVWDFAEANPFSESTGNFMGAIDWVAEVVGEVPCNTSGEALQHDAMVSINNIAQPLISTDPPYYDNVVYADLSDFFYVWLRRSLSSIYPDLFGTMLVPKTQELVATPYRFEGSKARAQEFFETGLAKVFERMRTIQNPQFPLTVYYAFKQAESENADEETKDTHLAVSSTGWETMLEALIQSGFSITGTWPIRTEMANRSVGQGTNALASSIVFVCRPRPVDAPPASRRQFLNALKAELPLALKQMQHGSIAPVDLAQASIGPGMAIYSRYSKVTEFNDSPLSIRTALQLINRALDEVLAEQEGEYDVETRWAVAWFEDCAMEEGSYGRAETLSKAKNMDIQKLVEAGLVEAKSGKVRLLKREELSAEWKPAQHTHLTVWEVMQRMIFALDKHGEDGAASVLSQFGEQAETARDLAYRLYTVCERKGWTQEALAYNTLVVSWSEVSKEALKQASTGYIMQPTLLGEI